MTQKIQNSKEPRLNISLTGESAILLEQLKMSVEKRLGIKVTAAFVVKLALREFGCVELDARNQ